MGIYGIYRDGEGRKLVLMKERMVRERMVRAAKRERGKKVLALAMALLCMAGSIAAQGETADAKPTLPVEQCRISKDKLTMYPNMTEQLKVLDAGAKVKWTSTDSRIVSVLGSRGKNQQIVTVRTKGRTGTCRIKAKVAGKTYSCKVTVKSDRKVSRVKLVKVVKKSKNIVVKVKILNRSGKNYWYGHPYTVEKFVNGAWKKVAPSDDIKFTAEVIKVRAHSSMDTNYVIASGEEKKAFTKGLYRLSVDVVGIKKATYALFSL